MVNFNPFLWLRVCYFAFFATLGLVIPYLPVYLDFLGLSSVEIGILIGVSISARIIAPYLWASWADRSARRIVVVRAGASLALLSFIGLYFVDTFYPLLIVTLCFNFFWNAILAQVELITLSHLAERDHHYSRIRLWGSLGFIVNVTLAGFIIEWFSAPAMLHLGTLSLLVLLISVYCITEPQTPTAAVADNQTASLWSLIADYWPFWGATLLLQVSFGPFYTFFVLYMEQLGWSASVASALISLGVVAEIVLFIFVSRLLSRFLLVNLLIVALLLTALRWFMQAWAADILSLLILSQLLHAASFGLAHAVSMAYLNRTMPDQVKGRAQALYAGLGFGLGGAIGSVMAGYLWNDGAGASLALSVAAFTALVAALFMSRVNK